jgi:hypothetical protein
MRNEMINQATEGPHPSMRNMAIDGVTVPTEGPAKVSPPIEYVTENGFSIVRLSELFPTTVASPSECCFLVRQPDGEESDVSVEFADLVVVQVQGQRSNRLSDTSDFWLTLAEQYLATYLWRNNHFPTGGCLVISQLASSDLVLAARWTENPIDE